MNHTKPICLFLLSLVLLFTASCGKKPPPDGPALNGVSLSEYAIVYSDTDTDYSYRAAQYLQERIRERTGLELPVQEDSAVTAAYEIVVGETERAVSAKLTAPTTDCQFAFLSDGKQIAMEGEAFCIAAAAYYFGETFISEGTFNTVIPTEPLVCSPITQAPRNYIFLIGDGMGVNQTKLFDHPPLRLNRADGFSDGESLFYGYLLPAQGFSRTDSLSGTTDSAAGGTALSTGYKTLNYYVGMAPDGTFHKNLTELANELGKATAVMSTEPNTGATPASFSAHVSDRTLKEEIIASQEVICQAGTIIVCDYDVYDAQQLREKVEANITNTLSQLEQDPDGFFLMYEEAHIDKHCHSNDLQNTFLALVRFNQAIGRFMEYTFYHPDTFLLITADHETGNLQLSATGKYGYLSDNHTNQDVPVFAFGQGSEKFHGQTVENVQIPKTVAKLWGVADFGDPSQPPAL